MTLDIIRRRLTRIEVRRRGAACRGAVRIISENEEDSARLIAELETAGSLGPGVLLIDVRLVQPTPRAPH